ncbi:MAG: hypothetical protein ACE5FH_13230 [Candidatus Zixiibacteriota bacterium]
MITRTNKLIRIAVTSAILLGMVFVAVVGAVELDGAKVFRDNCTKCHSERSPMEKTDGEWDIVVTHMRTIAGMTADEARAVLKFLKDNNGD